LHGHILRPHRAHVLAYVAPKGGDADGEPMLVAQPLPHRARSVGFQPCHHQVVQPRHLALLFAGPRPHPMGEQLGHSHFPLRSVQRRTCMRQPRRLRRGQDPGHPIAHHAETARQLALGPPRLPVLKDFHYVCHVEPPTGHWLRLVSCLAGMVALAPGGQPMGRGGSIR
jgi:hypothetical protein